MHRKDGSTSTAPGVRVLRSSGRTALQRREQRRNGAQLDPCTAAAAGGTSKLNAGFGYGVADCSRAADVTAAITADTNAIAGAGTVAAGAAAKVGAAVDQELRQGLAAQRRVTHLRCAPGATVDAAQRLGR